MNQIKLQKRYGGVVAYDGANYFGWQRQAEGVVSVQSEVEQALYKITKASITITGAGRTDRGVHGQGQAVSFALNWQHGADALQRAINVNLPASIRLTALQETLPDFHARIDAKKRLYHYWICRHWSPHTYRYAWHIPQALDWQRMNEAATCLVGTHDFATFGRPLAGDNTVRTVFQAEWQPVAEQLCFTISANAFLYHMVRTIVGTLVLVGEGRWTVGQLEEALAARDRQVAGKMAPAHGLFLDEVMY